MSLLFDENLSPRLIRRLDAAFPQSEHVELVGLKGQSDLELWEYAARHGATLGGAVMRRLMNVVVPHEPFNTAVRKGQAGAIMAKILEETKPEAAYFTEVDGRRAATLVINVESA